MLHRLQPHADVGVEAGVDEGDLPVLDVAREEVDLPAALAHDEVVGDGLLVLEEIALDAVGLVAEAQDEILVAEMRVVTHHMPEDRPIAHGHHWLGNGLRVFPQPHAQPAPEQDNLHSESLSQYKSTVRCSPSSGAISACQPRRARAEAASARRSTSNGRSGNAPNCAATVEPAARTSCSTTSRTLTSRPDPRSNSSPSMPVRPPASSRPRTTSSTYIQSTRRRPLLSFGASRRSKDPMTWGTSLSLRWPGP